MLDTQKYLELVRNRGKGGKELSRVYRGIKRKGLFLRAYANLYANDGALTPGIDPHDTVDGMSVRRIDNIIRKLEEGAIKWKPVRRTYIEKKKSSKKRPLGIPGWKDKLLQEAIRIVLETYYEPQFRDSSHGFRPNRGCHTALTAIQYQWHGMKWFIEGDIKGCFDNIRHEKLLEILGKQIKDERLLKLIRGLLNAGYMEDWVYHTTYSGTPQGGIISPLLANIYLNELDTFVEDDLIPKYTKGDTRKRKWNPVYQRLNQRAIRAQKRKDIQAYRKAIQAKRHVPVCRDDGCTWLRYVRYADDFLLGFAGTKREAEEIKQEIKTFLESLKLELSEDKTYVTNSRTGTARFLNYSGRKHRRN
jgi:group II intron reverse transcriptase/maturase